jgi:two-component system, response regulator RegA
LEPLIPANAPRILFVDDDETFAGIMARSVARRGFHTLTAKTGDEAMQALREQDVNILVVDLRLEQESGLQLIPMFKAFKPSLRILMLTGYASIATAVEAVKRGAENYLPKPANADDVLRVLGLTGSAPVTEEELMSARPLNPDRLKWEHIQRVLAENKNNISATARALGMHRRTLQRILAKRPVAERGITGN